MGRRHTASQLSVGLALLCGGWLAGCGDKADDSGEPVAPDVTLATCDEPVGGIPWDDAAPYESDTGLQVELAAMDFGELDETLDISELISFYRGFIAFALDVPPESLGDTLDRDEVLAMGPMGEVVLGSIIEGGSLGFDFTFYRRGLFRYYTCSREPPVTLEGFRAAVYDYTALEYLDVDSIAKCATRRLYVDHDAQVYVAESLEDGAVRETEILLTGTRADGNIDFLVYDADGWLTDRTQFPTLSNGPHVVVAAPYACMTCHFDADSLETAWTFDVLVPTAGPCAR